jgi:hypothetical protein
MHMDLISTLIFFYPVVFNIDGFSAVDTKRNRSAMILIK